MEHTSRSSRAEQPVRQGRVPRPREFIPILRSFSRPSPRTCGDRFIPNRAGMEISQALLTIPDKAEKSELISPSEAYQKLLADTLFGGRTRIFSFRNQTPMRIKSLQEPDSLTQGCSKYVSHRRQIPKAPEKIVDSPDLLDDYHLNLLDWGSANVLSIALSDTVYLWNGTNNSASKLATVDQEYGPVTSVSWAPDGRRIAVGLNSSDVQIWDSDSRKLIRTLRGIHQSRVGSLAWNQDLLTTGSMDCTIINSDVRMRDHSVSSYCGHQLEVCSLKWSGSGKQLSSGGSDGLLHIWDLSKCTQLHRFNHRALVKAIAWCPYQRNILASGEAEENGCIKLWDVNAGTCLKSVETGSHVSGLLWNKKERELLSSHWNGHHQLMLWKYPKYPSLVKTAELFGDVSGVISMAESPNRCTVASASSDEKLLFWNIFGTPETQKSEPRTAPSMGPTNQFSHIR